MKVDKPTKAHVAGQTISSRSDMLLSNSLRLLGHFHTSHNQLNQKARSVMHNEKLVYFYMPLLNILYKVKNIQKSSMAIMELTPANSHLSKLTNIASNHQITTELDQDFHPKSKFMIQTLHLSTLNQLPFPQLSSLPIRKH